MLYLAAMLFLAVTISGMAATPAAAQKQGRPGEFDYYALVLSWSPTYCAENRRADRDIQCRGPRPFSFVLHGLWPQYRQGWPSNCRTGERPWVPRRVIDQMLDIMPSPRLVIHQFRKHGVCSGLNAARYFDLSRELFGSVTIPERFRAPERTLIVAPDALEAEFLAANPQLTAEMIAVDCGNRSRLRELRICFGRNGKPTACGVNENQRRLCRDRRIVLPPVRTSSR